MIKVKRKLIKFSNYSLCITVPKKMAQSLGWDRGDLLNLYLNEQDKTIKLSKKKGTIKPEANQITETVKQAIETTEPANKSENDSEKTNHEEPVVLYDRTNKNAAEKQLRW